MTKEILHRGISLMKRSGLGFIHMGVSTIQWYFNSLRKVMDEVMIPTFKPVFVFLIQVFLVTFIMTVTSVFTFAVVYAVLVPEVHFQRSVYFDYSERAAVGSVDFTMTSHELNLLMQSDSLGIESALPEHKHFMRPEQPYDIFLELGVADTPGARDMGVFMINATIKDVNKKPIAKSIRPSSLLWRSDIVSFVSSVLKLPFVVLGVADERQMLTIPIFEHFVDMNALPFAKLDVELTFPFGLPIIIYDAKIEVSARLSPIQYALHHHTFLSWAVFVSSATTIQFISFVLFVLPHSNQSHTNPLPSSFPSAADDTTSEAERDTFQRRPYTVPRRSLSPVLSDVNIEAPPSPETVSGPAEESLEDLLSDIPMTQVEEKTTEAAKQPIPKPNIPASAVSAETQAAIRNTIFGRYSNPRMNRLVQIRQRSLPPDSIS